MLRAGDIVATGTPARVDAPLRAQGHGRSISRHRPAASRAARWWNERRTALAQRIGALALRYLYLLRGSWIRGASNWPTGRPCR
ncbi:MAG: hypothetical protein MZV65_01920 [Chromatiales bacterium]|nr:hypothetical protein [Chromatiales bacterium]